MLNVTRIIFQRSLLSTHTILIMSLIVSGSSSTTDWIKPSLESLHSRPRSSAFPDMIDKKNALPDLLKKEASKTYDIGSF